MIVVQVPKPLGVLAAFCCGCGRPDKAWQTILDYLENFSLVDEDWDKRTLKLETGEQYIVAYLLTHLDLLEHGGGVGGSWITRQGEQVRDFLRQHGPEWIQSTEYEFLHGEMVIGGGVHG